MWGVEGLAVLAKVIEYPAEALVSDEGMPPLLRYRRFERSSGIIVTDAVSDFLTPVGQEDALKMRW